MIERPRTNPREDAEQIADIYLKNLNKEDIEKLKDAYINNAFSIIRKKLEVYKDEDIVNVLIFHWSISKMIDDEWKQKDKT